MPITSGSVGRRGWLLNPTSTAPFSLIPGNWETRLPIGVLGYWYTLSQVLTDFACAFFRLCGGHPMKFHLGLTRVALVVSGISYEDDAFLSVKILLEICHRFDCIHPAMEN